MTGNPRAACSASSCAGCRPAGCISRRVAHRGDQAPFLPCRGRTRAAREGRRPGDRRPAHRPATRAADCQHHRTVVRSACRARATRARHHHPRRSQGTHPAAAPVVEGVPGLGMASARAIEAFFAARPALTEKARALAVADRRGDIKRARRLERLSRRPGEPPVAHTQQPMSCGREALERHMLSASFPTMLRPTHFH